jgi:hypothetical protein
VSRLMLLLVEQDDAWGTTRDGFKVIRPLGLTEDDDTVRPIVHRVISDLEASLPCADPGADRFARNSLVRLRELLGDQVPEWWPVVAEKEDINKRS